MSGWKIIIQIHYFFIKSDILNIHLTNLIQELMIASIAWTSTSVILKGGQIHGVKVKDVWKTSMKKTFKFLVRLSIFSM